MAFILRIKTTVESDYYFDASTEDEAKMLFENGDWGKFLREVDNRDAEIIYITEM